jgi:hypothetical protein
VYVRAVPRVPAGKSAMMGDNRETPVVCANATCTNTAIYEATRGKELVVLCERCKDKSGFEFRRQGFSIRPLTEKMSAEWRFLKGVQ